MDADFQVQGSGGHRSHGGKAQRDGQRTKKPKGQRGHNEILVGGKECMIERIATRKRESIGIHGQSILRGNVV